MSNNTITYSCPQCSQSIQFNAAITNHIICPYCNSLICRNEINELSVVKGYYLIKDSNDIIQPGSKGVFNGNTFSVCGRVRYWFDEAVYNYWTIVFDNNQPALLSEGYGLYSILTEVALTEQFQVISSSFLHKLNYNKNEVAFDTYGGYCLQRKNKSMRWDAEGAFQLTDLSTSLQVYELSSAAAQPHIEIHEYNLNNIKCYTKSVVSYYDLQITNEREAKADDKKSVVKSVKQLTA